MIKFATLNEARAAGYEDHGKSRTLEIHNGEEIVIRDVSGTCSFGYAYAVGYFAAGATDLTPTAHTVQVELTQEPNRMGRPGCTTSMFGPGEIARGIDAARAAIARQVRK